MELILEIGSCNGDLAYAFDVVHAAKAAGATAVKGQIYHRDELVTRSAKTYAQHGVTVPATQYEDFSRVLSYDEWARVALECDRVGIEFFASVFDFDAVELCEMLDVKRYKIASGDITYEQLIRRVAATGKQVILSTGASYEHEIRRAVQWVVPVNTDLILLACTLSYPTLAEDANLARMKTLRPIWPEVGYSDHTVGVAAIERAQHLNARLVEKHFTITPAAGGDHDFAVTVAQLAQLQYEVSDMRYDGDGMLAPVAAEKKARVGARRSMFAKRDLVQGSILDDADVIMLRPCERGLQPFELADYVGLPLRVDVPARSSLQADMF